MVQILPQIQEQEQPPSFLEGLGMGASQALPGAVEQYFSNLANQRQQQQSNKTLQRLTGQDLSGLDPETKKAFLIESLKQSGKSTARKEQQDLLSGIFNPKGREPASQERDLGASLASGEPQQQGPMSMSDEAIARATVINPALGRELRASKDAAVKEKREVTTAKEKKQESLRAETLPIKKEISDRAQSARVGIQNKENLLDIIERGDLNDPTVAAIAEALPFHLGKRILSPDTVEYKAGLIDEYKDLRNIFQGQTRVKEIDLLQEKTADIYLTDEQKKAILNSRIDALKADLIREETALELEEEGKNYSLLQYRSELEKRAKPKLEGLFHRILDAQKSIIKDAENMKKIPLNYDDPEGKVILEQIMKEAKGDRKKAREIAKKKGYIVGS